MTLFAHPLQSLLHQRLDIPLAARQRQAPHPRDAGHQITLAVEEHLRVPEVNRSDELRSLEQAELRKLSLVWQVRVEVQIAPLHGLHLHCRPRRSVAPIEFPDLNHRLISSGEPCLPTI
jgi:hypothetical protein